jgi:hypothetical protein
MTAPPITRPWQATMTAKLMRAHDAQSLEVIDYAHGEFTRRTAEHTDGSSILDDEARQVLLDDLRAEVIDPPIDVDRRDLAAFVALLEESLALSAVS